MNFIVSKLLIKQNFEFSWSWAWTSWVNNFNKDYLSIIEKVHTLDNSWCLWRRKYMVIIVNWGGNYPKKNFLMFTLIE